MAAVDPPDGAFDRLRRLAAGDPRAARAEILDLVSKRPDQLTAVMQLASRPGEGRVRQVAAMAARADPEARSALLEWLRRWLAVESDEFTRRALASVLTAPPPAPASRPTADLPRDFADTYRYVADRLCHQVRNALSPVDTDLLRLVRAVQEVADPAARAALTEILAGLQAGFERAARAVEFDRGDAHMTWAAMDLGGWLRGAAAGFAGRFGAAHLRLGPGGGAHARVWAAPFLLEVVFGNLWANAVHAVGPGCEFEVDVAQAGGSAVVVVRDNGPGFDEATRAAAFDARYSTRPGNTGRGLLEVAEAVGRLHGTVGLAADSDGRYRVVIRLPRDGA